MLGLDLTSLKKVAFVDPSELLYVTSAPLGGSEVREGQIHQHVVRQDIVADVWGLLGHLVDGAVYFEIAGGGTCTVDLMFSEVLAHTTWQVLKTYTATSGTTLLIQGDRIPSVKFLKVRLTNNQAGLSTHTWAIINVRGN